LLANAAGQLALINLTHPLREQARSHKGIAVKRNSMISAETSVGASLLEIAIQHAKIICARPLKPRGTS
jgi:hypothetical protein